MLLLACLAVGASIALFVLALGRAEPAAAAAADPTAVAVDTAGAAAAPAAGIWRRFAVLTGRLTPAGYTDRLRRRLDRAGNPRDWAVDRVLAIKGLALVVGALVGLLIGARHGVWVLPAVAALGAAGFVLPDVWVRNLGERRQAEIRRGLPDVIDMMTVCVEAGLGFDAALARVAATFDGPTAAEFARLLQEMQFGKSRADALRAMAERTDVPELRTFARALVQSGELGISVGDVLREQARQMRVVRRQRAEEKAQKLPVKILLPLITCMLPAMFVIVLGPAVLTILHTLGGLTR